jgi:hypothetical protein
MEGPLLPVVQHYGLQEEEEGGLEEAQEGGLRVQPANHQSYQVTATQPAALSGLVPGGADISLLDRGNANNNNNSGSGGGGSGGRHSMHQALSDAMCDNLPYCPLCGGLLDGAVALQPCGHTFCATCLSSHLGAQLQTSALVLNCPLGCVHTCLLDGW